MTTLVSSLNWKPILNWILITLVSFFVIGSVIGFLLASLGMDIHFNW